MSPPTGERDGARVETRCSCGAFIVMCKGEYHDCAVERDVALHKRQVEALEAIARRTPSEKQSPAAPAQPGEGEPSADEAWDMLRALVNACGWMGPASAPVTLDQQFTRARALLERRGGKGLAGGGRLKPYYEHGGITIYHGDCRDVLPSLPKADLVLTDPPYGIEADVLNTPGEHGWKNYGATAWDKTRPPAETIFAAVHAGRNAIVWGGNYFADLLPPSAGWLAWDKGQRAFSLADFELAWTSFNCAARCVVVPRGAALADGKVHPTQKSLVVMSYCVTYADARDGRQQATIVDPFMGSGTTLVTAKALGRIAYGIEIEERYCEIAAKRLAQEVLFPPSPNPLPSESK